MGKHWYAVYRSFDDETLAVLANPGLVRRATKDVEAGKVDWLDLPHAAAHNGRIRADGQCVELDGNGPQKARCDCSAPGICKHILAAAIWLRQLPEAHGETGAEGSATPADDAGTVAATGDARTYAQRNPSTDANSAVLAEVLSLTPEALFKEAGRSAVRQAAERLAAVGNVETASQGRTLVITLPDQQQMVRYVSGAGLGGMVSESAGAARTGLHLTALLAVWRKHEKPFTWPDYVSAPAAIPECDAISDAEHAFLVQIRRTLFELAGNGLSHVSEITAGQLRALNMSARAEGLPRLAAMLRNLAGTVDRLARRDDRASEREAIEMMARIHALCAALERAEGELLIALRGKLRRDFQQDHAVDLLPLGAYWWETRGGARGLTLSFWDSTARRVLQTVLARPDGNDMNFDRKGAWSRQSIWPGVGAAEKICEAALHLDNPRLADDGRIAQGGDTRATATPLWALDDPRWDTLGFDDWNALSETLRRGAGLWAERMDCVILRPHKTHRPQLDEAAQTVKWVLEDREGRSLVLETSCEAYNQKRIDNLERLLARNVDMRAVTVQVRRGERGQTLEPVALLVAEKARLCVMSLDFADEPARQGSLLAGRILRLLKSRQNQPPAITTTPSFAARVLQPVLNTLDHQMMTGRPYLDEHALETMRQAGAMLRSTGIETAANLVERYVASPSPDIALRLVYVCLLCLALDGRANGDHVRNKTG
ncbi:hypothetical protein GCM10027343_09420 [Noviherbaspirillum agri]